MMVLLPSLLLILTCLSGSLGHEEDLEKKVFVFPAANRKAAVELKTSIPHPVTNFTVCMRFSSLQTRFQKPHLCVPGGLQHGAHGAGSQPEEAPEQLHHLREGVHRPDVGLQHVLVCHRGERQRHPRPQGQYQFYLGRSKVAFKTPASICRWEHICVAWESSTGIVELWLNGVLLPRKGIGKGYAVSPKVSIVLGQDQDTMGGGFDSRESLVGELTDLSFFDRVLTAQEVA